MPKPRLFRFDVTVYKAKSPTDPARVPAAGATVEFYRQGAMVREPVMISDTPVDVQIFDSGRLTVAARLGILGSAAKLFVDQIMSPTAIRVVKDEHPVDVQLQAGSRLLLETDQPHLYVDPFGTVPMGTSTTADANGRVAGYIDEEWFDYLVAGEHLFIDSAGRVEVLSAWGVNVRDYRSLQDAIDALPSSGGEVHIPTGIIEADAVVVPITKSNVILSGVGLGSHIRAKAGGTEMDLLSIQSPGCRIRNLRLGDSSTLIRTRSALAIAPNVDDVALENVQMEAGEVAGLMLPADLRGFRAVGCFCYANGDGVRITRYGAAHLGAEFYWCAMGYNAGIGLRFVDEGTGQPRTMGTLRLIDCSLEGNRGGLLEYEGNAVSVEGGGMDLVELSGCYFENPNSSDAPAVQGHQFVYLHECNDAIVDGCLFFNADVAVAARRLEHFVYYETCSNYRHSNNVTNGPITSQIKSYFVSHGVEFANRNLWAPPGTIVHDMDSAQGILSLSAGAVSVTRLPLEFIGAAGAAASGSLLWVDDPDEGDSNLRVLVRPEVGAPYWRNVKIV